ncbi:9481_t:CDS:2, partial [Cetraspora pellucida]
MELRFEDKKLADRTARLQIYAKMKLYLTGVLDGYLRTIICKSILYEARIEKEESNKSDKDSNANEPNSDINKSDSDVYFKSDNSDD